MANIGIVFDPVFFLHDPGPDHPESPARLTAVRQAIQELGPGAIDIAARVATRDELLLVHTPEYVDYILNLDLRDTVQIDLDTAMSPDSREAALKAAGGVLEAVDRAIYGDIRRLFCAVRPPGHHAEPDHSMGFCVFNSIALGAAYALQRHNLNKVAIIDWDLHHGNGTQAAFYDNDKALYISLHQAPYYPGTGTINEIGMGRGAGYTINIPLAAGSSDNDFKAAFNETVIPALRNFKPELLFISAGFDAHRDDPLGDLRLTTEFFGEMTIMLKNIAREFTDNRIVSVLEGGYNLTALKESVGIHLRELMND